MHQAVVACFGRIAVHEVLNEWGHQLEEETLRNFKNGGQNVDWA